jgi:nucleoside-diphosphate-sugar epimerase
MSRALITGGAGFIGAHLAARLVRDGVDVDLVDDFSRARRDAGVASLLESGRVNMLQRDLRVPGALDGLDEPYDHIVHLAAIVGVAHVVREPLAVLGDSVAMLQNVVACAARQPALTRMVFMSTSEVYAGTLASFGLTFPTPETTPLTVSPLAEPRSAYMLSKIYGEAICRHAGVPFTILRPHNVYGPRMGLSHVIPELLQRAHEAPPGGRLEVASVEHRRTFCYVDDAVEIIWRAASSPACSGETLNLGAAEPEVAIGELARLIVSTVGKRLEIVPLPETPGSPPRRCPDVTRTRELTGYEARVGLESGVARTYDWYRRHVFTTRGRAA